MRRGTVKVLSDQDGATAVEYALMAALIALVIFGAVAVLGSNLGGLYDCTATAVDALPEVTDC